MENMNMNHFQTFISLCECRSFSETAKLLYVPQPTISNRIHFMENALNHELFTRGRRRVELTKAGELFLPYAKQILDIFSQAVSKLNEAMDKREIVIGSSVPFTLPFIFEKIQKLSSKEPEENFLLIHIFSFDIIQSLIDKDIDIAFVINPMRHKDIETHPIGSEDLKLVISAQHPHLQKFLNQEQPDLFHDFIVYYQPYYELFRAHPLMNLNNKRKFVTNHVDLIKKLLTSSNAVSFLPESKITDEIDRGELTSISINKELFTLSIPYFLMYRRNDRFYEDILLDSSTACITI